MGFTKVHTDLMYSALDHFLETDTPVLIFREEMGISFETVLGRQGLIVPNEMGNWDIFLDNNKIYEIEKEVYSIITHEGNSPPIDEYMNKLKNLSNFSIKEKSKKFVNMTKSGIEFLAFHGKINLKDDFTYGPFMVYLDSFNKKRIIILN